MISASSLALDPGGGGPLPGSYMSYHHHHHLAAHPAHHLHHHRASVQDRYPPIGVVPGSLGSAAAGLGHGGAHRLADGAAMSAAHLALAGQHAALAGGGAGSGQLYHHSKPEFARPLPKARYNGAPSVSTSVTSSRPVVMTTAPQQQHYSRRTSPAPSPTPGPVDLAQPKDQSQQPASPQINHSPIRTQPSTVIPSLSPIGSPMSGYPTNHRLQQDLSGYHQQYIYSNGIQTPVHMMSSHHMAQTHQYIKEREMYEARSGFVPPRPVIPNPVSSAGSDLDTTSSNAMARSRFNSQDKLPSPNNKLSGQQQHHQAFKVPSGKEGSLKHRILRPSPPSSVAPLSPQSPSFIVNSPTLLPANQTNAGHFITGNTTTAPSTVNSPMTSSATGFGANSNTGSTSASSFVRGSLIRLAGGELRRIEDMRTEDFVLSARLSPDLRLADSTVVKIVMDQTTKQGGGGSNLATLTLSYNGHRDQVDFESTSEHPFFVYGQGWASCSPERTLQQYGLKCNRLQVGDICISLTPRENPLHPTSNAPRNNIPATSKHQLNSAQPEQSNAAQNLTSPQQQLQMQQSLAQRLSQEPQNLSANQKLRTHQPCAPAGPLADVVNAANNSKKRRWSAPDNVREDQLQRFSVQNGKRYRD